MNEAKKGCKMQEVRIVVEHIHVYRYPRWRLRMPKVYIRPKTKKASGRWAYKLWTQVACATAALAIGFETYIIMCLASTKQGGQAMDWEWLAMILVGLAAYCVLSRMMDVKETREGKGEPCGTPEK